LEGGDSVFRNLRAEMSREGISKDDIAKCLDVNEKTVRTKLANGNFVYKEMKKIRNSFFPKLTIDYLFFENVAIAK
jgi:hypothetical protein